VSRVEHVTDEGAADESRPTGDEEHKMDYSRGYCLFIETVVEWG